MLGVTEAWYTPLLFAARFGHSGFRSIPADLCLRGRRSFVAFLGKEWVQYSTGLLRALVGAGHGDCFSSCNAHFLFGWMSDKGQRAQHMNFLICRQLAAAVHLFTIRYDNRMRTRGPVS